MRDSAEKHMAEMQRTIDEFNAGAPVPQVESSVLKASWEAWQRAPGMAIGIPELTSLPPEKQVAVTLRYMLLNDLLQSGPLTGQMEGEVLREEVLQAVASIECNKQDMAEVKMASGLAAEPSIIKRLLTLMAGGR